MLMEEVRDELSKSKNLFRIEVLTAGFTTRALTAN